MFQMGDLRRWRDWLTGGGGVRLYVSAVVLLAVVALVVAVVVPPQAELLAPSPYAILLFAVFGLGLEVAEHQLAVGAASGSIAFIVYLAAGVSFGPLWCAAIAGFSLVVAKALRGRRALAIAFNAAQSVLALVCGVLVYTALGGTVPPLSLDRAVWPFGGLVFTYLVINSSAVSGVVALNEHRQFSEVWIRNTWGLVTYDLIASAFGLGIAWLYWKGGIGGMAAVVLPVLFLRHTYLVNLQLQSQNRELLELMVKAIEARDPYTSGHSQRVSELARILGREMGLLLTEVDRIATAALLHDVGKIYEEFAPILRKEGKLTPEERAIMHSHPIRSAELVGTISNLRGYVHRCVRHHHENFDGTGYPDGLAGDQIPMGARIVLVADTTDAMTTDRPYRKALTFERVVDELERYAGKQFDPRVVAAFKKSVAVRRYVGAPRAAVVPLPLFPTHRRGELAVR